MSGRGREGWEGRERTAPGESWSVPAELSNQGGAHLRRAVHLAERGPWDKTNEKKKEPSVIEWPPRAASNLGAIMASNLIAMGLEVLWKFCVLSSKGGLDKDEV